MSQEQFKYDLATMTAAGVAVIVVRTREPSRVDETIRQFASVDRGRYITWDRASGAFEHDLTSVIGDLKPYPNADDNFVGDLIGMLVGTGQLTPTPNKRTFVSMTYPHWELPEMPLMVQLLSNYAIKFSEPESMRSLFLVVPETFALPTELSDCVTVMDFVVPNHEELQTSVINLFELVEEKDEDGNQLRPDLDEDMIARMASSCAGMTKKGAEDALARVLTRRIGDFPAFDVDEFCSALSEIKSEIVRKSEVLEVMQPVPIDRIGGLQNLKTYIIQRAKAFTQEARDFGVDRPRGIALIGPPGTGKSLGGKVIASVLNRPLVRFDISKVFDGLVGGSEKKTRSALAMLRAMAPCVAMVDEIDKVFNVNSGGGDAGIGARVLGLILTELQESDADVYWIMTANRTEGLPPELLRKGRLDEIFSVSLPNADERREVLKIHLRMRKQDPERIAGIDDAVHLSDGYVPAEIEAAVKEAVVQAYEMSVPVTGELIQGQLSNMVKLSQAFATQFEAMETWAANNARPASAQPRQPRERTRASPPAPRTPGATRAAPRQVRPGDAVG